MSLMMQWLLTKKVLLVSSAPHSLARQERFVVETAAAHKYSLVLLMD